MQDVLSAWKCPIECEALSECISRMYDAEGTKFSVSTFIHASLNISMVSVPLAPTCVLDNTKGSLLQCVMTPGDKWMPKTTDEIAAVCLEQVTFHACQICVRCRPRSVARLARGGVQTLPMSSIPSTVSR